MRTIHRHEIAGIASELDSDTIHVWLLDYQRSTRRGPLLALLGSYLGLPADDLVLVTGEYGRPELSQPRSQVLQFNWSHSADKAAIAIARDVVPGIDMERIRARPRAAQLAERFFHAEETLALAALDDTARELAFFRLWTEKEAMLKALGRGLAFGLHRLRLTVAQDSTRLLWLDGDDASEWQIRSLDLAAGYVASLAWRGKPKQIRVWTLAGGP
ncbi:4'-phosphopantetheinyl transferase superfamily protein [Dyella jejuensis]|uniref:4'-phosphopantetheinyl transferase superfamily protein n=1 Tax=Dyella jejuensis TaxID=1432009 RepID=A0ABW8JEM6_9GAMM